MPKKCTCLCKFDKKYIAAHKEELIANIKDPKFYCKKCLRVSKYRDDLCKPESL